jgi:hypothetical protein
MHGKKSLYCNKNNCCSIVKKLLGLVLLIKEEVFLINFPQRKYMIENKIRKSVRCQYLRRKIPRPFIQIKNRHTC